MLRAVSPNAASLIGSTTNDNAAAGIVGEFITATVAVGAAVALATAVTSNITSISLTAGDWKVWGTIQHNIGVATSITILQGGLSLTTATIAGQAGGAGLGTDPTVIFTTVATIPAGNISQTTGPVRVSLAATTTVFLVVRDTFTVSTVSAFGTISARRVR